MVLERWGNVFDLGYIFKVEFREFVIGLEIKI